jgi:hypothetical protein
VKGTRSSIVPSDDDDDDDDDWEPTSTLFILPLSPPSEPFQCKDRANKSIISEKFIIITENRN